MINLVYCSFTYGATDYQNPLTWGDNVMFPNRENITCQSPGLLWSCGSTLAFVPLRLVQDSLDFFFQCFWTYDSFVEEMRRHGWLSVIQVRVTQVVNFLKTVRCVIHTSLITGVSVSEGKLCGQNNVPQTQIWSHVWEKPLFSIKLHGQKVFADEMGSWLQGSFCFYELLGVYSVSHPGSIDSLLPDVWLQV